jgi:hypothetical protein
MKTTVWKKTKAVIYIGGDPGKGTVPEITIEIKNPQFQYDSETSTVIITESR